MPKINKLPPYVADLIAAGEVVERPASAAKELIENAIDAGAAAVTVEIQGGGSVYLRVTDDGCGMSQEDAQKAFQRHATSKISVAEDLTRIKTLGFRGEALAAISAVSRIDLLTREQNNEFGTSVHSEGGEIQEVSQAGCPLGTTIIIRDLFFNTPARKAFLKKENYEALQIQSAVIRAAQSHPEISFTLLRDGREEIRTSGNGDLLACLHNLWGKDIAAQLVEIKSKHAGGTLIGYAARPSVTRGSREMQYFFVNGRPVRSRTMSAGLEEAFRYAVPNGRFPICSLHLTLPEELFDVNVHPAKLEVKFSAERAIFEIVYGGVRDALSGNPEHKRWNEPAAKHKAEDAQITPPQEPQQILPSLLEEKAVNKIEDTSSYAKSRMNKLVVESPPEQVNVITPIGDKPDVSQQQTISGVEDFRYIGEVLGGYLIIEKDDNIILIDKHAAHERRIFEKLTATVGTPASQILLSPIIATLAPSESAIIIENENVLSNIGYEVSSFGGAALAIRAIPEGIDTSDAVAMLSEIAEALKKGKRTQCLELRGTLLEMIACKAAVKVGKRFSENEAIEVARWVLSDRDIWHCPHGRPIAVVMTRGDIEKQFLR
ncbi:MAG: DNA mismatch repair endonuclease MutL [Oscillospiraceae bacterium]|nr:DNA mismatch repair endonuclease MutL [Oscillospiraceae bacterium]